MAELAFASIKELREQISQKKLNGQELTNYCLQRFEKYDPVLKSALEIYDIDSILNNSSTSSTNGILAGIPGIYKANICQKDRITSCASKILANYRSPYDSTVSARLKSAGALSVGSANADEFAMGSSTETSAFKKTTNPWDTTRVPGGSSGGPAVAVAAGLVPWSLGSDTGGSIRHPAAFCGIVGLKPTYGLVSRYGLVAYGSSLDCIGPITRTVYDNALILSAIAGHDPHDSTTHTIKPQDYTQNLTGKLPENFTLGVIDNAMEAEGIDPEVYKALQESLKVFEKLGAKIKRITLPSMDHGAAVYFIISRAEAASNLARFDGVRYGYREKSATEIAAMYERSRSNGFGWEVKRRILIGNYVLSAGHADAFYKSANTVRAFMRHEFLEAFKDVNLLFAPTAPAPAFKFGAFADNKLQMDLQDYFTAPVNLAQIPAISVPCGFATNGLPIGFQLFGPDLSEAIIYQAAYAYEQQTDWHTKHPTNFT